MVSTAAQERRRGWLPLTAGLALAASAAWLDYAAGPTVYLAPVYLVPVSLAAWYGGRRSGAVVAAATTGAWLVAQLSLHVPLGSPLVAAWNSAVHLGVYLLVNELLCRLRMSTERLEATVVQRTAAFEEQQRLTTRIAETMPSILYIWDLIVGRITYANSQVLTVLGLAVAELQGMDAMALAALVHPEDLSSFTETLTGAMQNSTGEESVDAELRVRDQNGSWHWLATRHVVFSRTADGHPTQILGIARDITAHKREEEQARRRREEVAHRERLNMAGELATSLAHEIGQPLTAIGSYADSCAMRLESGKWTPGDVSYALTQISAQAKRAETIIRRLREFVRKGERRREYFNLNVVIGEIVSLCAPEARQRDVQMSLDLRPELPPIEGDRIQIEQVILNLLRNAIEAVDGTDKTGGAPHRVTIQTCLAHGGNIVVHVRDNGRGLPAEVCEHVFDPFFTSKPDGMGMGLAISRSIIEDHGGRLWATPNQDRGATFHVRLPAAEHHYA